MNNATRRVSTAFGTLFGLVGIEHAIGEILQGPVRPAGVMILSWPDSPFFEILAGEPAMTLVPNLLVSGILAALASLAFIVWAARRGHTRAGGPGMILLSIVMLLVGAGFGPPLLGILLGAALTLVARLPRRADGRVSPARQRLLARLAPATLIAGLLAWLLLFPGASLLGYFFELDSSTLVPALFFTALGALGLALWAAAIHDRWLRPA